MAGLHIRGVEELPRRTGESGSEGRGCEPESRTSTGGMTLIPPAPPAPGALAAATAPAPAAATKDAPDAATKDAPFTPLRPVTVSGDVP